MIENLSGLHETVNYRENMKLRLYHNRKAENYPAHWHTEFELIMPLENGYDVNCNGIQYHLREKDLLIICPSVIHEIHAPLTGSRIIFQPYLAQIDIEEMTTIISLISSAIVITPETHPRIHQKIYELMLEIRREYFNTRTFSEIAIYCRFLNILVHVGRSITENAKQNFDAKDKKKSEYMEKFIYICKYINEHYNEELTLEEVADLAGFSKYHFGRLFHQFTDTTFYQYVNQVRISNAKELLLNPNFSVTDVALRSGFSSPTPFLRLFKKITGFTPTQFRKLYVEGCRCGTPPEIL